MSMEFELKRIADSLEALQAHFIQPGKLTLDVVESMPALDLEKFRLQPSHITTSDTPPKPKRKRRTKAQIAADEAKEAAGPTPQAPEPVAVNLFESTPEPVVEDEEPVVESGNYTRDDVTDILRAQMGVKGEPVVVALMAKYGATSISTLDPKDYDKVYAEAEAL